MFFTVDCVSRQAVISKNYVLRKIDNPSGLYSPAESQRRYSVSPAAIETAIISGSS